MLDPLSEQFAGAFGSGRRGGGHYQRYLGMGIQQSFDQGCCCLYFTHRNRVNPQAFLNPQRGEIPESLQPAFAIRRGSEAAPEKTHQYDGKI